MDIVESSKQIEQNIQSEINFLTNNHILFKKVFDCEESTNLNDFFSKKSDIDRNKSIFKLLSYKYNLSSENSSILNFFDKNESIIQVLNSSIVFLMEVYSINNLSIEVKLDEETLNEVICINFYVPDKQDIQGGNHIERKLCFYEMINQFWTKCFFQKSYNRIVLNPIFD
jgi:hypothetical protein